MAPYDSTYGSTGTPSSRPVSKKSHSQRSRRSSGSSENTPLLSRDHDGDNLDRPDVEGESQPESQATSSLRRSLYDVRPSKGTKAALKRRWPSLVALLVLCIVVIIIMVFGFVAPRVVEEYSTQAATFEPSKLSIDAFTSTGVRTRVQGDFYMDPDKVGKQSTRNFGKFATYIARQARTSETRVDVRLPDYSEDIFGSAVLPSIKVDLRAGKKTPIDILSDIKPGSKDPLRRAVKDWMDGKLNELKVHASANVKITSGIVHLSGHDITQELIFRNDEKHLPSTPQYNITKIDVHENKDGGGMAADVSISVSNNYPVELVIPPLRFGILIDNCLPTDPYLHVAEALTRPIHVKPKQDINVRVSGYVRDLSKEITDICPNSRSSPLDELLGHYIKGDETIIYVRGAKSPEDTPDWIGDIASAFTVPVPLAGHTFDHLIKNFSLTDTHFALPDPAAEPGTPEANPKISTDIEVLVGLPEQMNFPVDIGWVNAKAHIFYEGDELGILDLDDWQKANSSRVEDSDGPALQIQSEIRDAPVKITDSKVFSKVVQKMLFGKETLRLKVDAKIDAKITTALGELAIRKIPAQGVIPIKPFSKGNGDSGDSGKNGTFSSLKPKIGNLSIVSTTPHSISLTTFVNFTNPTNYSATVPYADLHILINDTVIGNATAKDVQVNPGRNENILVTALYRPKEMSGDKGEHIGLEAVSRYISGMNVTLSIRTHEQSFPTVPAIGSGLSALNLTFPAPRPRGPDGDDDDSKEPKLHFIEYTEMHILSSTANFHLFSPLTSTTLSISWLNATASYHNNTVGHILYDESIEVPPGRSVTPRLPVDWSIGSVGFDAVRKALGGTLKLDAYADVQVRIGAWVGKIWVLGHGIGAHIRP